MYFGIDTEDTALRFKHVLHVVPHAKDILHVAHHQNQTGLGKKSGQKQKIVYSNAFVISKAGLT